MKQGNGKILGRVADHDRLPEGAVLDENAWDHEHCELCMRKISEYPKDQHEGYTDGKNWLCINCYLTYIVPREGDQNNSHF